MKNRRKLVEATLIPHSAYIEGSLRLEQCFAFAEDATEPICIAVVGESRTGKSRLLEELEASHPRSRSSEGLCVPILRVKTPSKPTVKGLAELLLRTLGDPKYMTGTETVKTARLQTLMINAGTVMVVIDEFQHFFDKGSRKVMHHVADWLKILVDDCKVALVVAGLPSCVAVINQNEQLSGRFLAPILMPRFDWMIQGQRSEFMSILDAFYEALSVHLSLPELGGDEIAFRCYCGTGGLMGYLAKFLRQVVWNAIDSKSKVISLEDLERAHEQAVWSTLGITSYPNPFSRKFPTSSNIEVLDSVRKIGVPMGMPDPDRVPRRRTEGAKQTAATVLRAR